MPRVGCRPSCASRCRRTRGATSSRTLITGAAADVVEGAVDGVGVAVPGPFDYANGVCLLTHKLEPLHGVDLRRALADALRSAPASIAFVNDADAFLLGEAWVGAARATVARPA